MFGGGYHLDQQLRLSGFVPVDRRQIEDVYMMYERSPVVRAAVDLVCGSISDKGVAVAKGGAKWSEQSRESAERILSAFLWNSAKTAILFGFVPCVLDPTQTVPHVIDMRDVNVWVKTTVGKPIEFTYITKPPPHAIFGSHSSEPKTVDHTYTHVRDAPTRDGFLTSVIATLGPLHSELRLVSLCYQKAVVSNSSITTVLQQVSDPSDVGGGYRLPGDLGLLSSGHGDAFESAASAAPLAAAAAASSRLTPEVKDYLEVREDRLRQAYDFIGAELNSQHRMRSLLEEKDGGDGGDEAEHVVPSVINIGKGRSLARHQSATPPAHVVEMTNSFQERTYLALGVPPSMSMGGAGANGARTGSNKNAEQSFRRVVSAWKCFMLPLMQRSFDVIYSGGVIQAAVDGQIDNPVENFKIHGPTVSIPEYPASWVMQSGFEAGFLRVSAMIDFFAGNYGIAKENLVTPEEFASVREAEHIRINSSDKLYEADKRKSLLASKEDASSEEKRKRRKYGPRHKSDEANEGRQRESGS